MFIQCYLLKTDNIFPAILHMEVKIWKKDRLKSKKYTSKYLSPYKNLSVDSKKCVEPKKKQSN